MVLLVQMMGIATIQDVRNLGSKTMSDVINAEVDFEIDGTKAKSIVIAKKFHKHWKYYARRR
ncbi:hypothetical protein [Campylobacter upsaliensis]|uniref:hypothetical protein n=1 Tax=Campylobacter upsaliensis TaxID=28080 RepID=UPI0022EBA25A|nr:hypothetical protein [Campylobacter upsaliensis]